MPLYKQFVDAFRVYGPSQVEITIVIFAFLGVLLLLIARGLWMEKAQRERRRRGAFRRFLRACRQKGLFPEEIEFLVERARRIGQELDTGLVESNVVFDNFAARVIQTVPRQEAGQVSADIAELRHKFGFRPPPRGFALNSTREIGVGQVVYIVLSQHHFLEGRVDRVDERFQVVRLSAGQPAQRIVNGSDVWIYFNRPGDARYSGVCRILKNDSDERGQRVTLSHCEKLQRDQRRQDFRVEENRTICLWVIDTYLQEADDPYKILADRLPERAMLEDLSAGGASVIFHREMPVHQGIYINLDPADTYGLPVVRGTIVRVHRRGRINRWALSVRFEDLRPSERQRIVRHVFRREREELG